MTRALRVLGYEPCLGDKLKIDVNQRGWSMDLSPNKIYDLAAEEMRERCAKEAEAMSEHADLNNLSGQCAATLIADEIRDLSLREES